MYIHCIICMHFLHFNKHILNPYYMYNADYGAVESGVKGRVRPKGKVGSDEVGVTLTEQHHLH